MVIHTIQPLITSFYIKKGTHFYRISAKIRNFLRNGRVRVKTFLTFGYRILEDITSETPIQNRVTPPLDHSEKYREIVFCSSSDRIVSILAPMDLQ